MARTGKHDSGTPQPICLWHVLETCGAGDKCRNSHDPGIKFTPEEQKLCAAEIAIQRQSGRFQYSGNGAKPKSKAKAKAKAKAPAKPGLDSQGRATHNSKGEEICRKWKDNQCTKTEKECKYAHSY